MAIIYSLWWQFRANLGFWSTFLTVLVGLACLAYKKLALEWRLLRKRNLYILTIGLLVLWTSWWKIFFYWIVCLHTSFCYQIFCLTFWNETFPWSWIILKKMSLWHIYNYNLPMILIIQFHRKTMYEDQKEN